MLHTRLLKCADPFTNFVTYALGVWPRKIDEQARLFVLLIKTSVMPKYF